MSRQGDQIRSYRWQQLAKRVLNEETVCWLCGLPLDYDAEPRTRWYPSVDHVVPRSQGGDVWDRANLRACHFGCNGKKGDGVRAGKGTPPMPASRQW